MSNAIFYGRPLAVVFLDMDGVMIDRLYDGKTQWKISEKYLHLLKQPRYTDRSIFSEAKADYIARKRAEAACISENALRSCTKTGGWSILGIILAAFRFFLRG